MRMARQGRQMAANVGTATVGLMLRQKSYEGGCSLQGRIMDQARRWLK